ncbi:MAG: PDZ domain-containing protein [Pirellulales bacterium]
MAKRIFIATKRLGLAVAAALAVAALSTHAGAWQLTPEQREELRKKVEEQLKDKPKTPLSGEQMKKLMEQLHEKTDSQIRPPREESSRRSGGSTGPYRKMNSAVLAAFREVVSPIHSSTVVVRADGKDASLGAIVGESGWILTKSSEIKGKITCRLADGRELAARVIGVDDDTDLAMLKVNAKGLPAVTWETEKPQVGDWVATAGTSDVPASVGVVSVLPRGVMAPRGILGIGLEQGKDGAQVREVMPGSGAAKAGMVVGDTVLSVNGKVAKTHEELIAIVAHYAPGDTLTLVVRRDGKEITLKATLGARPTDGRSNLQNTMGGPLSERRSNFAEILQHDSVLRPDQCGGPLVNLDGKVVGINIARAGRVESYAIPAAVVTTLIADLQSGRLMPPPPIAEYEKELADALASLRKSEDSVREAKEKLDKVVDDAQEALKNVESARKATQKAVENAQAALGKAKADAEAARNAANE